MAYPIIQPGMRITAGLLQSMQPVVIDKTVATSRTSTTTFADDPDLTAPLAANAKYLVQFHLHYGTPAGAGFKTIWTVPSGASGVRVANGAGITVTDAAAATTSRWAIHNYGTAVGYGERTTNTSQVYAYEESVLTTTSAGTVAIQWAQTNTNATATIMQAGSYMRVTRIA